MVYFSRRVSLPLVAASAFCLSQRDPSASRKESVKRGAPVRDCVARAVLTVCRVFSVSGARAKRIARYRTDYNERASASGVLPG